MMIQISQWVMSQVMNQPAVFRLSLGLGLGLGVTLGLGLIRVRATGVFFSD